MLRYFLIILFVFSFSKWSLGQSQVFRIKLPDQKGWNLAQEGQLISFKLSCETDTSNSEIKYLIQQGKQVGMELDSSGKFSWIPDFHLVERAERERIFQFIIEAISKQGNRTTANVELRIAHVNRPPVINELLPFYMKFGEENTYKFRLDDVKDEDNDLIVFIPYLETFPEGMTMNTQGDITWKPSFNQFKSIKEKPIYVEFYVQDQPAKSQTRGKIKVEVTQMDLPPKITSIPKNEYFKIKENENINIRFYLSDPNGDEDIETFDFVSNQPSILKSTLTQTSNIQYEFVWMPGYDFVQDPRDSLSFYIDFFVLDKSQKREVKRINFTVLNTVNEAETDKKLYGLYYGTLARAWELLEQLKEKEEELKKSYSKARKGKKHRSVVNASLGASTGLSSILSKKNPDTQRMISTVGGTTVLTIGTLEATEVIGKSMKDLIDRLNYVIEKKNEIQTKGDIFTRDFSLKAARRNLDFIRKVDDFMTTMNLKGLVALELSASWESKSQHSENNIKRVFKDFNPWQ